MIDADEARVAAFFSESELGLRVYRRVAALVEPLGPATVEVTKSQVTFRRRTGFCWLWLPGRYLARPKSELVLSCGLLRHDPGPRWKEVVHVSRRRWMHHLEVRAEEEIDAQVAGWLAEAYQAAA